MQVKLPLPGIGTRAELVSEPLGVVLIFSTWNFPFGKVLNKNNQNYIRMHRAVIKLSRLVEPLASARLKLGLGSSQIEPKPSKVRLGLTRFDLIQFCSFSLFFVICLCTKYKITLKINKILFKPLFLQSNAKI